MPLPFAAQLSVELTKVLPVRQALSTVASSVYNTARDLRKSGSDLLVEEDLAAIFSRGKIEPKLQTHFRDAVKLGSVTPLHHGSLVMLDSQPGPTTQRAIRDQYYLSAVIQLSLLSWLHERSSLADTLVECMNKRHAINLPDSNNDANYDGIMGTLCAVSAETSQFPWALYIGLVEAKLPSTSSDMSKLIPRTGNKWKSLTPTLLLAAMDYLYVLQSLPDDRIMQTQNCNGTMPLVIWAHYVLGLTVMVQGTPDGNIMFGEGARPNVIINWVTPKENDDDDSDDPDSVFLLDGSLEVVLHPYTSGNMGILTSQERIPLEGYGTTFLRREFNRWTFVPNDAQLYSDCAQFSCVLALCMSQCITRSFLPTAIPASVDFDTIPMWRVTGATELLFSGIEVDSSTIYNWTTKNAGGDLRSWGKNLPVSIKTHIEAQIDGKSSFLRTFGTFEVQSDGETAFICTFGIPCAILILIFAHVSDLKACTGLPLVYGFHTLSFRDRFTKNLMNWNGKSKIFVDEDEWFNQICKLLVGIRFLDDVAKHDNTFLLSEYGWSIFFTVVGESDPSDIDPTLLCVQRGVPLNPKTNERKYCIRDAPPIFDPQPPNAIVDKTGSYVPRCISRVVKTVEHYSSRTSEFWRTCRFDIDESSYQADPALARYSIHCGYRLLHRNIWKVIQTDPCEHAWKEIEEVSLSIDAVTVKGFRGISPLQDDFEDRICILLVKGDWRARWLALADLTSRVDVQEHLRRNVTLRSSDCCEDCATKVAAQSRGKWLIIL